jgi:hypothetical protein
MFSALADKDFPSHLSQKRALRRREPWLFYCPESKNNLSRKLQRSVRLSGKLTEMQKT